MKAPGEIVRHVLDRSRRLGIDAGVGLEVYAQASRTTSIKVFDGQIEALTTAEPRGLGVRAIDSGRVGYAYTGDLSPSGLDAVVLEAAANARAADPDPFVGLPEQTGSYDEVPGLWRPGVSATGIEQKVEIALRAEATALAEPEIEVVEESEYTDSDFEVALASSAGVFAEGRQSFALTYLTANAARGDDRQSGLGFSLGRSPEELRPVEAGREAAGKAQALLGASPCSTGRYTVVLRPTVAAAFLTAIAGALSADAVQKGRSLFGGKLGHEVAAAHLELSDDGLAPEGLNTSSFDAEGIPRRRTRLLSAGLLESYLHDTYTARKEGGDTVSTGNSSRGSYRSLPGIGASNLVLSGGQGSLDDLLARVGEGLLVDSVAGIHSGINPATGEISVGVMGRLIEGGATGRPVREITIATDFLSLLQSITHLAGDHRWVPLYGSVYTPSFAVQGVAVSGV